MGKRNDIRTNGRDMVGLGQGKGKGEKGKGKGATESTGKKTWRSLSP